MNQQPKKVKEDFQKKDWNRNIFSVRTNDEISDEVKSYCSENKISTNKFFIKILKTFFSNQNLLLDENTMDNFKRISVSVVPKDYEKIKMLAEEENSSIGLLIRRAIKHFIDNKLSNDQNSVKERNDSDNSSEETIMSNNGNKNEDIINSLEKIIRWKISGDISEEEYLILKSKLIKINDY